MIADLAGWRVALLLYGTGLPMAVLAWRLLPPDRPSGSVSVGQQVRDARQALRHPVITASLASGVLVFVLIFGGFLTVFPIHLEQEFGLGASARGLLISVPAFSSSLIAFNLGRIRNRFGLRPLLVLAGTTYVIAFAGVAASPVVLGVLAASILYGVGEGFFIPSLQDAVAEAAPPAQRAAVFAVWVGAARLGQSIGPLLAALALSATTTSGAFVLGAGVAVVLLAAQVFGPIGRREPTEPTPTTAV